MLCAGSASHRSDRFARPYVPVQHASAHAVAVLALTQPAGTHPIGVASPQIDELEMGLDCSRASAAIVGRRLTVHLSAPLTEFVVIAIHAD